MIIRKISIFLLLASVVFCGRASGQPQEAADGPAILVAAGMSDELRRLRADAEDSVARLDTLREMRDAADGERRAVLEAELDAVYAHIEALRQQVADLAVRTGSAEAQRRLEFERQQRMLNEQSSSVHNRIMEQQQRLERQQMQEQRRLSAQPR